MEKDLEKMYAQRDKLLVPVMDAVKYTRDALLAKYAKTPKKLGDWNFEVDDSSKTMKKDTGSK